MTRYEELQQLLGQKTAKIGVIGLGYVGLPLAVETVKSGYTVVGIDLHAGKIESLKKGESYVQDVSNETLQECLATGRFFPTTDYRAIEELDAISICVPTPLSPNQDPDTSYITNVVEQIKQYMRKGLLITLESTTYPGTTEELIGRELEKLGYVTGVDFFLCYSPERVDPGNRKFNTYNTPKIIGGTTERCIELGTLLYGNLVKTVVPVSSPKVAEMSKLLENTFRSVNIAFMNEMAMMCDRMGINVWEVIKAASTKPFGFMPFYPGPGIGGHCIPLDPMYLSWKAKGYRFHSQFIEIAQSINDNMPDYVLNKTAQVLNIYAKAINSSRILILGMAYKPDVDDLRESPGLEIYELFKKSGAQVDYYDPYAQSFVNKKGQVVSSIENDYELFKTYDCMVLITNHKCFHYQELADLGVAIIDTRNAFDGITNPNVYRIGTSVAIQEEKEVVSLLA
ncbi:UDP-N-acetyl-D-glucosamine dehydrogenase [Brevibacillus agri]|uniref:Nucleotide sugar dehydrogenase n=1 Tax=Brevibacillus agri TaxID=51101 RepID=A0A3M8AW01_9BACL|nr:MULTISPECIES: nucleotide sugar dehydrogenase [Brevibacillus]ELK41615.1 UDP-glucose/GDP-mannose dehydrogenase [Brevibacillus agri BAB-2500]EJL43517.1 nucleotide sugar dehydrogenase [Brevibacillus sp. CF112]MBG9567231.1 UDP-N-acetyl-D-glucosamine dehydrogenase [Brevibacillus agri]MBY0052831.1 nucleotide sugar dehydrogenase [Brevibacillus agri]MCG5253575.1 nucleotide sugar dehydrogenase [Brevibacillus agri]